MATKALVGLFFLIYVTAVYGKKCYYYTTYPYRDYIYCSTDCCGTAYSQYCCDTFNDYSSSFGTIIGSVVGGIISLVIVISVIVACCCCRRQGRPGAVVMNPGVTSTTVIGSQQQVGMYPQTGYVNATYPQFQTSAVTAPSTAATGYQPPPPYPGPAEEAYPGQQQMK